MEKLVYFCLLIIKGTVFQNRYTNLIPRNICQIVIYIIVIVSRECWVTRG